MNEKSHRQFTKMEPFVFRFFIVLVLINSMNLYIFDEKNKRQETPEERWRPILSVEAILISVQNMLSEPNDSSPANIDAAV